MAERNVENVDKYLQMLPEFNGDPHVLTRFIDLCDKLVEKYVKASSNDDFDFVNSFIVSGILNKITGAAGQCVRINGANKWEDIKKILLDRFADHRDEAALCAELCLLTQGHRSTQVFYEQIQKIFSTIMSLVAVHDQLPTTVEAKRKLYEKIMLQTFLCGLNEPLGSRVRCMRPITIDIALKYALEEQNAINLQQNNTYRNSGFPVQNGYFQNHGPFKPNFPQSTGFGSGQTVSSGVGQSLFGGSSSTEGFKAPTGVLFGAAAPSGLNTSQSTNSNFSLQGIKSKPSG